MNDILRSSATKSGETDDAEVTKNIYVVNYADDGGFAILAADTLMETILAYSDQEVISPITMDNSPACGCLWR
ncbi:MAG: Spi family protease inhibitor [Alistipes indistinctus]